MGRPVRFPAACAAGGLILLIGALPRPIPAQADEGLAVRITSFTLAPPHRPQVVVWVRSFLPSRFEGVMRVEGPAGWKILPAQKDISVAPDQTVRVVFGVEQGTLSPANRYPLTVTVERGSQRFVHRQDVAVTTAPYLRPKIDGKADDWKDALPVEFLTQGKKTTIATGWNRKTFCLLVSVEEERQTAWGGAGPCDAVQLALAAQDAPVPRAPQDPVGRQEFLLVSDGQRGRCFRLAEANTLLAQTQRERPLAPLGLPEVEVAVTRTGGVTDYECAIPFKLLGELRPGEGREFCLSVLVHDPDGTGIRDWGEAAGLWAWERSTTAWTRWPGAVWGAHPPFDSRLPWGLCSSKY